MATGMSPFGEVCRISRPESGAASIPLVFASAHSGDVHPPCPAAADLLSLQAAEPARFPCLLESAAAHPRSGRFDLLMMVDTAADAVDTVYDADPFALLDARLAALPRCAPHPVLPFAGGYAVFLGYEAGRWVEPRWRPHAQASGLPEAQLLRVPGVVEVNPIGGYRKEILIAPDPARLLAYGLSYADLVTAVEANNGNRGAGFIERNGTQQLMRMPGQAEDLDALANIVLRQQDGVPLRVRDVATVTQAPAPRFGAVTRDGEEVVLGMALARIGENATNGVTSQDLMILLGEATEWCAE